MNNNELYHYGVVGMKWGVRRYQNADGSLTYAGKKKALKMQSRYTDLTKSRKYNDKNGNLTYSGRKKALRMKEKYSKLTGKQLRGYAINKKQADQNNKASKPKKLSEMSDDEIRAKINRLDLERRYAELTRSPQKQSRGKDFVQDVLERSAKNIATQATTYLIGEAVNKSLGKKLGDINMVNPKKGQKDK